MARLAPAYTPRRPTDTVLYRVVREHMGTLLRWAAETYERPLPRYVGNELRAYLRCGVFAHGFVRARCDACGHELLVAFSCHGRAMCPSCSGRRMASTAAHLVDRVLPPVAVRQYVLSLPFELRPLAAFSPDVLTALSRGFVEAIFATYRRRARADGLAAPECGAVTFVQRFGSSLNLNVHFHVVVLDGVFTREGRGRAVFHPAPAPTRDELRGLLARVQERALAWLRRRGLLREAREEERADADGANDALARCAEIATARGTYERLPTDEHDPDERNEERATSALAVERDGFSLHAGVHIAADDDVGRERVCRYGARPPLALDRLRMLRDGRVAYRVKYATRGRAKHRVMTPLELLARLAALIPPPRYPLVRYHGVLGPRSSWRKDVVPVPPPPMERAPSPCKKPRREARVAETSERASAHASSRSPSVVERGEAPRKAPPASLNRSNATTAAVDPASRVSAAPLASVEQLAPNILRVHHWERLRRGELYAATPRVDWAKLLRRSFDVDVLECPTCHGRLRVLGAVTDPAEARALLAALGRPTDAPRAARARDPTALDAEADSCHDEG